MKRFINLTIVLMLASVLSAGCASSPTFLNPYSSVSGKEADTYHVILWMAAGVFVLVWGLLIYNIIRYRRRKGDTTEPAQKYGNWRLEFVWTAVPVFLVLMLFIMTVTTIAAVKQPEDAPGDVKVDIVGHQWWWEFDYPDLGVVTANELHVPVGTNVEFHVTSADVIHSFWVPQLSHKIDAIPGQTNELWFNADTPGVYEGQCSEFCGLNHAHMHIIVVVEPADQFAAWVKNQQQPPVQPSTKQEQDAYDLITGGLCSSCHTLGDNQAVNPIGPNLTHLMSRSRFAGDMLELTPDNLRKWLQDTQAIKPGNDMKVSLTSDQIDMLMAYLTKLK